jgi:hypothetical protein
MAEGWLRWSEPLQEDNGGSINSCGKLERVAADGGVPNRCDLGWRQQLLGAGERERWSARMEWIHVGRGNGNDPSGRRSCLSAARGML